jgi:hypothetical protein
MSAFKRDNGRQPTADEIANRKSHTSSKADQIEKDKDTALQKAEAKAQERIDKLKIFDPADPATGTTAQASHLRRSGKRESSKSRKSTRRAPRRTQGPSRRPARRCSPKRKASPLPSTKPKTI